MKFAAPRMSLPLLGKELAEQAARRRTYVTRVAYATLLFMAGFMFYYQMIGRYNSSPFAVLGKGRELFQSLVNLQFAGIFLFMPAITCGAITVEKERNSLGLLFLTRLGPWTILLEKYLGRAIPMFSFLILSLPLMVIAYSLGGITPTYLWSGVWFLTLATFQFGALALMCSTLFRTTIGAFVGSYLLAIFMVFTLPVVDGIFRLELASKLSYLLSSGTVPPGGWSPSGQWAAWAFMPAAIWEITSRGLPTWEIALASVPTMLLTIFLLFLARYFLVRHAFLPPANIMLQAFRRLDTFFTKLNDNRWTKGRVLISDNTPLECVLEPVAWRETTKTSFGAFRYLIRLLLILETPVAVIGILLIAMEGSHEPASALAMMVWIVAVLIISAKATSLVTGERTHETLDALLTTPMRSREIVLQKFQGVKRLMLIVSAPLLTTILLKAYIIMGTGRIGFRNDRIDWIQYLVCALITIAIYLPMVAWLALLIGLRIRSQSKAIFTTLGVLIAWCVLPVFLMISFFEIVGIQPRDDITYLLLFSPATIIPMNEFFELNRSFQSGWFAIAFNCLIYGTFLLIFRYIGLSKLDHHLGRSSGIAVGHES